MKKTLLIGAALTLAVLMILSSVPVYAWTYPDGTEDYKYEKFGPRADRIYIPMYGSEDEEWDAMETGAIDISDWPLTYSRYTKWTTTPPYNETIMTASYGPEIGMFIIDVNNDNNTELAYPDPDPTTIDYQNPVVPPAYPHWNPCADVRFRHALWHAMDRDYVIREIWKGMGYPMTTVIVPALELAYPPCPDIDRHPFDTAEANRILDDAGYIDTDGDGWRNYPGGPNIVLIFYARADHYLRDTLATWYTGILQDYLHIKVDLRHADRRTCFFSVMVDKNFHLYTGGWGLGPDPDYLVLYQSWYYWHPGFCYNYGRVNCSAFDEAAEHVIEANTVDEAKEWAAVAQCIFNNASIPGALGMIPVVSSSGYKAWYKTYTGGNPTSPPTEEAPYVGKNWTHLVNVPGYGPDSYFTFLNAHPEGFEYGLSGYPMTMRYGFKTLTMEKPSNPVYAEWVWDWAVLGMSYESLLARDPYTFDYMPWLCKDFEPFTWFDTSDRLTKSGVRFVLRDDVYWSDGTPMTAADVFWTLVDMTKALKDAGLTYPWWYSNTIYIKSMYMTDPYNIEILLDIKSVWAIGWIGGCIILPKHIWKPLLDSYVTGEEVSYRPGYTVTDFYAAYVDPDVIATGPYRFKEYVASDHTLLVANKPGSTVKTAWDHSVSTTSPGYFRYRPVEVDDYVESPSDLAFRHKLPIDENWTLAISATNLIADRDVSGYSELYVNDTLIYNETDIVIGAQTGLVLYRLQGSYKCGYGWSDVHFTRYGDMTLMKYCKHFRGYYPDGYIHSQGVEVKDMYGNVLMRLPYSTYFKLDICTYFWIPLPIPEELCCIDWTVDIEWWQKTHRADIGASTFYDDVGMPDYPYKSDLPTCDYKVDMKDVGTASRAFGSYPGHPRWWTVADIVKDYKVDMKDIGTIARFFGWSG